MARPTILAILPGKFDDRPVLIAREDFDRLGAVLPEDYDPEEVEELDEDPREDEDSEPEVPEED